jgi:uncharacterized membrane protein YjfL (UPF0719 family)
MQHGAVPVAMSIDPFFLNLLYALAGGLMTLFLMWGGWKLFDFIVPFSVPDELAKGNVAVGITVMGMFIALGLALGLVIGLSLN